MSKTVGYIAIAAQQPPCTREADQGCAVSHSPGARAPMINGIFSENQQQSDQIGAHGDGGENGDRQDVNSGISPRQKGKLHQTQAGPDASQRATRDVGVLLKAQVSALSRCTRIVWHATVYRQAKSKA